MTTRFESGKTYMVGSRCDRVYFKVVARTAKTATIELIGIQRNASQYDEIKIDVAGTGETQKTRLHIENDMEFGYLKVETENAWGIAYTDRVCIEPKKAVTISSTVEENTEPTAENNTDNTDTTTEAEENTAQVEETEADFKAANTTTDTAHVEYKPQTAWENPHDFATVGNLNGQPRQYVNPEAIAAPKGFWANRINGTFTTWINGEFVSFENHSIAYIDAEKKLGYHYKKSDAGRKIFYRGNHRFAASKIVEAYMNGQKASEQNKAHHEFFDAHKTAYNKFFQVLFRVTTADGRIHNFERTFDSFDDAKALVDKFTAAFSEPTDILIKRNGRLAPVYYTRTDGLPGTYTMFYFGEDGFDPEVFNLLPALDDLNDVEDEPVGDDDPDGDDAEDDADNDSAEDNVEAEGATEPREGDWEISNKLTRKLNRNVRLSNYTEVITQDGERTFVNFGAPHVEPDGNTDHGFAFVHYDTTLGRYDTREQAETVINRITVTVERGEEKFIFPTVEELTAPKDFTAKLAKLEAERDTAQKNVDEKQAVLIKAQAEHEKAVETWRESNCAIDRLYRAEVQSLSEKLLPLNIAAVKVTKQDGYTDYVYAETLVIWYDEGKFIIRGDCSIKKYCLLAKYDTPEQVTRVINGLKAATEHETKFKFPAVEELNQPSKDDLRGSLKRAAEIARKKYHEYEREGDNDGMLYEIELFNICADAIKDLEAA